MLKEIKKEKDVITNQDLFNEIIKKERIHRLNWKIFKLLQLFIRFNKKDVKLILAG